MPLLSIIIPTFNEAPHIGALIKNLRALPGAAREIIVSDGGSTDETRHIAQESGAIVVENGARRGAQLNAGVRVARGEILWFVHADARIHRRSLIYLESCGRDSQIHGGNFRLRFEGCGWPPHFFARIARQQRRVGIYYGDSGIWARREIFVELNGFADWPLFEDYDFARRLQNYASLQGGKTALAPWPITVSARRFQKRPLRVLRQWLWLQTLFSCGASPERLAKIYRSEK